MVKLFAGAQPIIVALGSIARSVLFAALIGVLVASAIFLEYWLFHVIPNEYVVLGVWPASILFIASIGATKAQSLILGAQLAATNGIYYAVLGLVAHGAMHVHALIGRQPRATFTTGRFLVSLAACVVISACVLALVFRVAAISKFPTN